MNHSVLSCALVLLAPASLCAQSVLIVDDDGGPDVDSTSISGAIAAASDGDLILVRSGTYGELLVIRAKGLSIVAEAGAQVTIDGLNFGVQPGVLIEDLAPTQAVYLHGLSIGGADVFTPRYHILLQNNSGPIWIEQCAVTPGQTGIAHDGIGVFDCSDVTITRSTITTGGLGATCLSVGDGPCGNGLVVTRSSVYLFDSIVQAAGSMTAGVFFPFFGGTGAIVEDGDLYASDSMLLGGPGIFQSCGLQLNGGGAGLLLNDGSGIARLLDSVATGAPGADSLDVCGQGPDGPDTSVGSGATLTNLIGSARNFSASSPLDLGQDILLTYKGLPGDLVILGYNLGPTGLGLFLPGLKGVILTLGPAAPVLMAQGTIDASGTLNITIPGGPITLSGAFDHFVSQPIFFDGSGPTVGTPSQIVIITP